MSNKKIEKFKSLVSKKESGWLKKANWREENEKWLDISFAIAVKILSALRENKKADIFPSSQKELAEAMDCSPQYVNKLLKGAENLQLETISKIGNLLSIKLIEIPNFDNEKEASNTYKSNESYEDFIPSVENSIRSKSKNTKTTAKTEKVKKKGLSYCDLMEKSNFEEDLDNDLNSPLKLVA